MKNKEILIDPEFKALIPALNPEELSQLEENLISGGCRDALVIWPFNGSNLLLDGHNRKRICEEYGIPFQVVEIDIKSRDKALLWIIENQEGRRNLNKYQRAKLQLKKKPIIARLAKENQKTHGNTAPGKPKTLLQNSAKVIDTREELAKAAKVSHDTIHKVEVLEREATEELKDKLESGEVSINQAYTDIKRKKKEADRNQNIEENVSKIGTIDSFDSLLNGSFSTIVLDPPWSWQDEGDISQFGRGNPTYSTMTLEELLVFPVDKMSSENAHIYLWITNRSLPKGFDLLDKWGFRYITTLTWCKPSFGMGNYFRGSTEHVLFGIKGSLPLKRKDVGTWFEAEREGKHSTKPQCFFDLVESCSHPPYLELFSRKKRDNWVIWGEEGVSKGASI